MQRGRLVLLAALLLATALPLVGLAGSGPEGLERNRLLLEKWRTDPEHWQRLQHSLQAFAALPPARQRQLRLLDLELNEADPALRSRLWRVLHRYTAWLDGLPEEDRRRVGETADPAERLRLVRAIKERQWVERLPKKLRAELAQLPEKERKTRIKRLRDREQIQRRWRPPNPLRFRPDTPPRTGAAARSVGVRGRTQEILLPEAGGTDRNRKRPGAKKATPPSP